MSARQKIEGLTASWYGYCLFSAVLGLVRGGIGFFSLLTSIASFGFMCLVTWFLGRRLLANSSATRMLLIVVSGAVTLLGAIGTAKAGWAFVSGDWSLSMLMATLFAAISVYQYGRSFRVLTDDSVKSYFA